MHLSPEFGYTYKEIQNDRFNINKKVEILMSSDSSIGISKAMGLAQNSFSEVFDELNWFTISIIFWDDVSIPSIDFEVFLDSSKTFDKFWLITTGSVFFNDSIVSLRVSADWFKAFTLVSKTLVSASRFEAASFIPLSEESSVFLMMKMMIIH